MSNMGGQRSRWTEYFQQLYMANSPGGQLQTADLQIETADSHFNDIAPSPFDVKEDVARLRSGKSHGVCKICVEVLKTGCLAMLHEFQAVLTAVCQTGNNLPD